MQSCNIYLVINDKNICRIAWQFNLKPVFALAPSWTSRHLSINSFIYLSTFMFILYTCVLFLYFYPPKKQVEKLLYPPLTRLFLSIWHEPNIKLSPFRLFHCLIGETTTFIWQHEFYRFIFQSTVDGCQMANELSTITRLYTPPYSSAYDSFLYSKFYF